VSFITITSLNTATLPLKYSQNEQHIITVLFVGNET